MPRARTMVAFVGGLLVAFLVGLVPAELVSWLRDWSARPGPDPDSALHDVSGRANGTHLHAGHRARRKM